MTNNDNRQTTPNINKWQTSTKNKRQTMTNNKWQTMTNDKRQTTNNKQSQTTNLVYSDQLNFSDSSDWSVINQKDNCRIRIVYLVLFSLEVFLLEFTLTSLTTCLSPSTIQCLKFWVYSLDDPSVVWTLGISFLFLCPNFHWNCGGSQNKTFENKKHQKHELVLGVVGFIWEVLLW